MERKVLIMTVTPEERNYLKSKMIDLLEEYDYTWEDDALDTILDTWIKNKGPLIELFKKHPNYVEGKFMIAFNVDYDREIDVEASRSFRHWLLNDNLHLVLEHMFSFLRSINETNSSMSVQCNAVYVCEVRHTQFCKTCKHKKT